MRPVLPAMFLAVAMLGACGSEEPGTVSIRFGWDTRPADATELWATIEVRERPVLDAPGRTLAAVENVRFVVGEGLTLTELNVPNGSDRQVVIELRGSPLSEQRVRYYGLSERFSLMAGETQVIPVALVLSAPATEANNTLEVRRAGGSGASWGPDDIDNVDIHLTTRAAVVIELANNASFTDATSISVSAPACAPDPDGGQICIQTGWDLTRTTGSTSEELFTVYARFVDANGYGSPIVRQTVGIDATAPRVLSAAVSARWVVPGHRGLLISATVNEDVQPPTLIVTPPVGLTEVAVEEDGRVFIWQLDVAANAVGSYSFAVEIADLAGNSATPPAVPLMLPSGDTLVAMTVTIDGTPPTACLETLSVARAGSPLPSAVEGPRRTCDGTTELTTAWLRSADELSFELRVADDGGLAPLPIITVGDLSIDVSADCTTTVADSGELAIICTTTIGPSQAEGAFPLTVAVRDLAGNQRVGPVATVVIDRTPPGAIVPVSYTLRPDFPPAIESARLHLGTEREGAVLLSLDEPALSVVLNVSTTEVQATGFEAGDVSARFVLNCAGQHPSDHFCSTVAGQEYTLTVTATDRAGNVGTISAGRVNIDRLPPDVAAIDTSALSHYRAPWGRSSAVGTSDPESLLHIANTPFGGAVSLRIHPTNSVGACRDIVLTEVADLSTSRAPVTIPSLEPEICFSLRDRAGNVSPSRRVTHGELIARVGGSVDNPLSAEGWEGFHPLLFSRDTSVLADTTLAELDATAAATLGAGAWTQLSPTGTVASAGFSPFVFDVARGLAIRGPRCLESAALVGCTAYSVDTQAFNGHTWLGIDARDPELDGEPSFRMQHAMVYDAGRAETVLFGGIQVASSFAEIQHLNDTWLWDGESWRQLPIDASTPPSLWNPSLVYDPGAQRVLLLGEVVDTGVLRMWRLTDGGWVEVSMGAVVPVKGRGGVAVWDDAVQKLIMWGGVGGGMTCGTEPSKNCTWTWAWDDAGWTVATLQGPPARIFASAAYDPRRQRVVSWGGCTAGFPFVVQCSGPLWEWDGVTWSAATPMLGTEQDLPGDRIGASMAYDPLRRGVLLSGGTPVCSEEPCAPFETEQAGDTWLWDGLKWTRLDANHTPPTTAAGRAIAFDPVTGQIVTFGGFEVDPFDLTQGTQTVDATHSFEDVWRRTSTVVPPSRGWASFVAVPSAIDDQDGRALLFGGLQIGPSGVPSTLSDAWVWQAGQWTVANGGFPPRYGMGAARNAAAGEVLVFGGFKLTGGRCPAGIAIGTAFCQYNETLVWNEANDDWTSAIPRVTDPEHRGFTSMAYDPVREKVVMFGGVDFVSEPNVVFGDTWEWSAAGWVKVHSGGQPGFSPDPRQEASMVWAESRGTIVLFGGEHPDPLCDGVWSGGNCRVLWEWDGTRWSRIEGDDNAFGLGGLPPAAVFASGGAVWDDNAQRALFVVGTDDAPTATEAPLAALYEWSAQPDIGPAHVLRVPLTALGLSERPTIEALTTTWWSAAQGGAGTHGMTLEVWGGGRWNPAPWASQPDATAGDALAIAPWASSNLMDALPGEAFVVRDSLHLAATTTEGNVNGRAQIQTDYVEVHIGYTLSE